MAKRLVISVSPRAMGKCAHVAKGLVTYMEDAFPADEVEYLRLPDLNIHPCTGCNVCRSTEECCIEDDMTKVMAAVENADLLYIVAPIYFGGPSANYKAMLDRFQPHYWSDTRNKPRRSAYLIAFGDGGDPYGHQALEICTRSALVVAGFEVLSVNAYIGVETSEAAEDVVRDLFELKD